jgi:hypothetical protein
MYEQRNDYIKDRTAGKKDIKRGCASVTERRIACAMALSCGYNAASNEKSGFIL